MENGMNEKNEGYVCEKFKGYKCKEILSEGGKVLVGGVKERDSVEVLGQDLLKEEFDDFEYDLPNFDLLAEDFDIEKVFEKESSFLLREVRKIIVEKLSAYLQLFETFMNPGSSPMFVYNVLRNIDEEGRDLIKGLYKRLSGYQLRAVRLDTVYVEGNEAKFILEAFNDWQKLKHEVYCILERLERDSGEKLDSEKNGYFN